MKDGREVVEEEKYITYVGISEEKRHPKPIANNFNTVYLKNIPQSFFFKQHYIEL